MYANIKGLKCEIKSFCANNFRDACWFIANIFFCSTNVNAVMQTYMSWMLFKLPWLDISVFYSPGVLFSRSRTHDALDVDYLQPERATAINVTYRKIYIQNVGFLPLLFKLRIYYVFGNLCFRHKVFKIKGNLNLLS